MTVILRTAANSAWWTGDPLLSLALGQSTRATSDRGRKAHWSVVYFVKLAEGRLAQVSPKSESGAVKVHGSGWPHRIASFPLDYLSALNNDLTQPLFQSILSIPRKYHGERGVSFGFDGLSRPRLCSAPLHPRKCCAARESVFGTKPLIGHSRHASPRLGPHNVCGCYPDLSAV